MLQFPSRVDLWDVLYRGEASGSNAQDIGPQLEAVRIAGKEDDRHKEDDKEVDNGKANDQKRLLESVSAMVFFALTLWRSDVFAWKEDEKEQHATDG